MTSSDSEANARREAALRIVRVVGPPGSGKTLLITTLIEALRSRGVFTATSAPREGRATVITASNGARITAERLLNAQELRQLTITVDPRATLLLAESLEAPGTFAIEIVPPGAQPTTNRSDLIALVSLTPSRDHATFGPAQAPGLADLLVATVLRCEPHVKRKIGLLGRLFRRA